MMVSPVKIKGMRIMGNTIINKLTDMMLLEYNGVSIIGETIARSQLMGVGNNEVITVLDDDSSKEAFDKHFENELRHKCREWLRKSEGVNYYQPVKVDELIEELTDLVPYMMEYSPELKRWLLSIANR